VDNAFVFSYFSKECDNFTKVLIEIILHHTKHTEIKLTDIQDFRRICFLLRLGRGLKMGLIRNLQDLRAVR
jgi:hypothetical protein